MSQPSLFEFWCARCGCPRPRGTHPCPECRYTEFSLEPVPQCLGWKRRRDAGLTFTRGTWPWNGISLLAPPEKTT